MAKPNTRPVRIDRELENELNLISRKNGLSMRQASQEAAKQLRRLRGKKFPKEIVF